MKTKTPYHKIEREKARTAYKRLSELGTKQRVCLERGLILPVDSQGMIDQITRTTERGKQVDILQAVADRVRSEHLARLLPWASTEFNAFCEYIRPEEPPAGVWLEWLTQTLQDIETKPGNERFVLNCPPGHAKPLCIETPILMGDGTWKRLGDVKVNDIVITHTGLRRKVTEVHEQGELDVLKITTLRGREIIAAPDHSFLVHRPERGFSKNVYLQANQLAIGDVLSVRGHGEEFDNRTPFDLNMFEFAGYMTTIMFQTQGVIRNKAYASIYLMTTRREVIEASSVCMKSLDINHSVKHYHSKQVISSARVSNKDVRAMKDWFVMSPSVRDRRVPLFVFKGGRPEISKFLSTVMTSAASVTTRENDLSINIPVRSIGLAGDFQKLFSAFGIHPKIKKTQSGNPKLVLERDNIEEFLASGISFEGPYADRLIERWERRDTIQKKRALPIDAVKSIQTAGKAECRCLTVEVDHTFIANGIAVHNSTYASRLFVAWRMGRRPRDKVIGGGHSQRFVENEFSKKIRSIVGSTEYRDIFPNTAIDSTTRAADQWALTSGGSYVAKGAGQAIHGFRANLACIDDPYAKISDAESAVKREEIRTWFFNDIGSRLLPGAQVFLIMTRFHEDDLTGQCMEMNKLLAADGKTDSLYKIVTAPAICNDEETDILGRSLGEILWPYYSLKYFEDKRVEWTFQRFALVYQQMPDATADGNIASKLRYYSVLPHQTDEAVKAAVEAGRIDPETRLPQTSPRDVFRRIILSVDTAAKTNERADYSVGQVWGETNDRKHYLLDQFRDKVEMNNLIAKIESMAKKWGVDKILVEDKGQGTSYLQARGLTEHQHRLAPAPLEAIKVSPNQGKEFRFDEIAPIIEEGSVFLPSRALWTENFVREVGQFPEAAHDDQVDAMSQYLRWAKTKRSRYGSRKVTSQG